ncbi:MAG: TPM domain-containing protein [Oscillospiraceae bacterium]|nr:TPM domain-containing protein [Oscillospiraceae bacterium]
MKKIGIVCLLLALLVTAVPALAPAARAADLPQPSEVFYVLDQAGVLSDETWEEIVTKDESLETQTGAQLCVVTVEFIGSARISDYAYELFNEWGIGDKTKNNGVLLLLVTGAEDYYMLQGKGLEEVLPSSELQIILDEYMEPFFAQGDYDAGVRATAGEVFSRLADWYGVSLSVSAENIVTYPVQLPGSVVTVPGTTNTSLFGGLFGLVGGLIGFLTRGVFGLVIIILIIILCVLSSGRRRRIYRGGMYRGFRPPMTPPPGGFGVRGPHVGGPGMGTRGPGMGPGFGPRSGPGIGPRPGNFGSRPGSFGSSHHSSFGGTRSGGFGGGHTGGFGGGGHSSHVGGGGASRGGGAGRH